MARRNSSAGLAGRTEAPRCNFFTHTLGIPAIFAFLAIIAELLGSIALIAGFLSRLAALGVGCVMVVAVLLVHLEHGFFMNWAGSQQGEGFEYHLLAIGIALALIIRGGGALSLDGLLQRKLPQ